MIEAIVMNGKLKTQGGTMMPQLKSRKFYRAEAFLLGLSLLAMAVHGRHVATVFQIKVAFAQQTEVYITTSDVNIRSGPGTRYGIVARIKEGTRVNVVGGEGEWLKVVSKHGNPPGYIDRRFARLAEGQKREPSSFTPGVHTTVADTYVRKGPGLHYEVITQIPKGIRVHVVAEEGDWLRVESKHGNLPGYVEKRYARPQ